MVGEVVKHVRFGKGNVISFEPQSSPSPSITVRKRPLPTLSLSASLSTLSGMKSSRKRSRTGTRPRSSVRSWKWLGFRKRDGRQKKQTACV